jgi:ABC-type protease/lipase transport system fused ATPase/permease subunit
MNEYLRRCRFYFLYAGLFSLFINLALLALPLYMLQVFDKVLPGRSTETLLMLTLAAVFALLVMAALEAIRARILLGAGVALDNLLGPPVLDGLLSGVVRPGMEIPAAGLRDVGVLRGFLTGSGIFALFDSPWVPIYLGIIYLFDGWMGTVALIGAGVLFALACRAGAGPRHDSPSAEGVRHGNRPGRDGLVRRAAPARGARASPVRRSASRHPGRAEREPGHGG